MERTYSKEQARFISYSDVLVSCTFREGEVCRHAMTDHSLVYVYSGKLTIISGGKASVLKKGECAFLARNFNLEVSATSCDGIPYSGVFLVLDRKFLMHYYQCFEKSQLPQKSAKRLPSVSKLQPNLQIDGLFAAFKGFLKTEEEPTRQYLTLKQLEAAHCLTEIDCRFCVSLFDFLGAWKMDILGFMESNYKEELSLEEMALYTGRSLATFKRDFSRLNSDTPGRWITKRRLHEAHRLIAEEHQMPSDIYLKLGFKSLSHFSTAFKRQYGESPTALFNKAG